MNNQTSTNDERNTNSANDFSGADLNQIHAFLAAAATELHRQMADHCKQAATSLDELERLFRILHKAQALELKREQLAIARLRAEKKAVGRVPLPGAQAPLVGRVPSPGVPVAPSPTAQPTSAPSPKPTARPMTPQQNESWSRWIAELTGSRVLSPSEPYTPSWIKHRPPPGKLSVFPPAVRNLEVAA